MVVIAISNTSFEVKEFQNVSGIDFNYVVGVPIYTIHLPDKDYSVNGNEYRIAIM